MKKIISFLLSASMLAGTVGTITVSAADTDITYTKPYLLTLDPDSEMDICWLTSGDGEGSIEIGETDALGETVKATQYKINGMRTSAKADGYDDEPTKNPELDVYQQIATVKNLKPDTTYYYRATTTVDGKTETTKTYNFKTAPEKGGDFTFALLSDLQMKAESPATVKQIGQNKPDFIIYEGDMGNTPWKAGEWFDLDNCFIKPEEDGKTWFEIMQQEEDGAELLQYTPIFTVPGNHEVDDQRVFSDKERAAKNDDWSLSIYMQLFRPLYPEQEYAKGGKHWYSVDYGDLHISNISCFRWQAWDGFEAPGWAMFDDISKDSAQVKWLENDLASTDAKYKWVNMHWHMLNRGEDGYYPVSEPVIEGDKAVYPNGDYAYDVLKPIYEKYGVDAVSFGHSHVYERYLINGVNYIEAASIGNNYRGEEDPYHPSGNKPVFEKNDVRSFMILTKNDAGISAKGIAASGSTKGQTFDEFYVAKNDTAANTQAAVSGTLTQNNPQAKNIIMMIPDGQSVTDTTLARWYKGGTPLAVDEMMCGLVRTYSSDAAIADSAPSGTAYATGFKSHTGFVGVLPDVNTMPGMKPLDEADKRKPVASILEAAQLLGKSTGLIATSEIMHATPADFSSHDPSRKNYDSLSEQEVYQDIDVVLGSGEYYLKPEGRKDGENLVNELKSMGYDYITTPDEMKNTSSSKIWGMFAPKDLSYEMDRDPSKQPSLAEMTKKAIDTLSKNENGFFLLVEGSKVDWASHANDPIGIISDTLAYDDAVKAALDFAKKDGNTVVISVTDHGNGGMTIGSKATDNNYDKQPLEAFIDPLKKASRTGEGVEKLFNEDMSNIVEIMAQYYGITDLTDEEIEAIKNTEAGSMNYTVGPMISKRANIGWTTNGHTGEDVPLYIYAPENCKKLGGVVENTDIANYMADLFGVKLADATNTLFVQVRSAAEAKGAEVTWNSDDVQNPVVIITKGGDEIKIPINKNIAYVNGSIVKLDGVTVFNGINTYVPQSAIELIK